MEWIAVFVIGVAFGYLAVLLWLNRNPEPSEEISENESWVESWNRELPTRDDRTPMDTRILTVLGNRNPKWNEGIPFPTLRWECSVGERNFDDKEFWDTIKRLEREGKITRIADPTPTIGSLWVLVEKEETDE